MTRRHLGVGIASVLSAVLLMVPATAAEQGGLDPTFGSDGLVESDLSLYDFPQAAATTPDGEVVVAGAYSDTGDAGPGFLAKYSSQGVLDSTFGSGGVAKGPVDAALGGWRAIAVQSDGRILVGGMTPGHGMVVARYETNGALDSSFSQDGIAYPDPGGTESLVTALVLDRSGEIVAAGSTWSSGARSDIAVTRLDSDGTIDTGFGSDGYVSTDCGLPSVASNEVALRADNSILVTAGFDDAGGGEYGCLLALTGTGRMDASFGDDGKVTSTTAEFRSSALQSDGAVIVASPYFQGVGFTRLTRFTGAGVGDPQFGVGGVSTLRDPPVDVAVQADDRVVVLAAGQDRASNMAVRRVTRDGKEESYLDGLQLNGAAVVVPGSVDGSAGIGPMQVLETSRGIVAVGYKYYGGGGSFNVFAARIISSGLRNDPVAASVSASKSVVVDGEPVVLSAAASSTASGYRTFRWDLDGNGTFERDTGADPTTTTSWPTPGTWSPSVQVVSGSGNATVSATRVTVTPRPPAGEVGLSVNNAAAYTTVKEVTLNIVWPEHATSMRVSNDGGFNEAVTRVTDPTHSMPWTLDGSIAGMYTKIVYVRFSGSGVDSTRTYSDDIIFDNAAPEITRSGFETTGGWIVVSLAARDLESGPATVQVANGSLTASASYESRVLIQASEVGLATSADVAAKSTVKALGTATYSNLRLRVADRAGNWSGWTPLTRRPGVSVRAVAKKGKLRVDIDPNMGAKYWTFKVQAKSDSGEWRTLKKTYRTHGTRETRTLNLKKGVYRVVVRPRFGYQGATSTDLQLER